MIRLTTIEGNLRERIELRGQPRSVRGLISQAI
jgi:hypothetical protein